MTARHATAFIAAEINQAVAARELVLRDRGGLIREEMIFDARPSDARPGTTALSVEHWIGAEVVVMSMHLTAAHLTATIAFLGALRDEAGQRSART